MEILASTRDRQQLLETIVDRCSVQQNVNTPVAEKSGSWTDQMSSHIQNLGLSKVEPICAILGG
jgi:hypothetical protein